jgi:hypothetical protein
VIFPITGGSKDILVGDLVFLDVKTTADGDLLADSYRVLAFGSNGKDIQVRTMDNQATMWLTTSQIMQVWRAV